MLKIYLALPYTGKEEESFVIANKIAAKLMNEGHLVFSPISHSHPIATQCSIPGDWNFWKAFDESFISWCDQVMIIPLIGWQESKGVTAEIAIAKAMNKPVSFISLEE